MTLTVDLHPTSLIDLAGQDGLQGAIALFGAQVNRIAPFQSTSVQWQGVSGSLLRLCENNFRLRWQGDETAMIGALQSAAGSIWVRSLPWLTAIAYPAAILDDLVIPITPTPPHQLTGLPLHCAAVGRLEGRSLLVWHYGLDGQPVVELQMAAVDQGIISRLLGDATHG
ncbi:MAG: hypothetical protein EA367_08335 [Leptolyngbya sp. DLM2.Bin15]|nr:MAG: hypothetical protein EA367_08335 [Leptolyngbya sp. DLM2.Bin15]